MPTGMQCYFVGLRFERMNSCVHHQDNENSYFVVIGYENRITFSYVLMSCREQVTLHTTTAVKPAILMFSVFVMVSVMDVYGYEMYFSLVQ